jgi:hypothetical protein
MSLGGQRGERMLEVLRAIDQGDWAGKGQATPSRKAACPSTSPRLPTPAVLLAQPLRPCSLPASSGPPWLSKA